MTCSAQEMWTCSWTLSGDVSRCMCAGRTRPSGAWHLSEWDGNPIHEAAQLVSHPNSRPTLAVCMSSAAHVRSAVDLTRQSTYSTVLWPASRPTKRRRGAAPHLVTSGWRLPTHCTASQQPAFSQSMSQPLGARHGQRIVSLRARPTQ